MEFRAPPTGHHVYSLSGYVQQALPRKEYRVGKQLIGPLQKQLGAVCDLTPPSSRLWGCLHRLELKIGLLTLKNRHVMNKSALNKLIEPGVRIADLVFRGFITFTVIQCLLYLCISSGRLLLN